MDPKGNPPPYDNRGPPQTGYPPPQQWGYPPPQGGYPPPQGGYPPPQGGYPPPQGGYPPPQGYAYHPPPPVQSTHTSTNVVVVNAGAPSTNTVIVQKRGVNHCLHCCISIFFPPWIFVWIFLCVTED